MKSRKNQSTGPSAVVTIDFTVTLTTAGETFSTTRTTGVRRSDDGAAAATPARARLMTTRPTGDAGPIDRGAGEMAERGVRGPDRLIARPGKP